LRKEHTTSVPVRLLIYYVDIAKITPAVNWPGLAYSAQQLLKTRGTLAPVPPTPLPTPMYYSGIVLAKFVTYYS